MAPIVRMSHLERADDAELVAGAGAIEYGNLVNKLLRATTRDTKGQSVSVGRTKSTEVNIEQQSQHHRGWHASPYFVVVMR